MKFELLPTIDLMYELYEKPRSIERFNEYLKTLQGDSKGELIMPVGGFNPMAKEHILDKLTTLKNLSAEKIMQEALADLNQKFKNKASERTFKVALNLSDDLKGGWTNRYTSDYDSKFKINALVQRGFCTPIFWTSESFYSDLIQERTLEYAYRTIYWLDKPKPLTLEAHLAQEIFVAQNINYANQVMPSDFSKTEKFFKQNMNSDNYQLIFNFFYGDEASQSLAFVTYGIAEEINGFEYAKYLAQGKNI
jgi:hypothetical protein